MPTDVGVLPDCLLTSEFCPTADCRRSSVRQPIDAGVLLDSRLTPDFCPTINRSQISDLCL
ncbi:hypothetical protein IEQ34_012986 [Dendrobium chrysotoxum]|uniref:Uncharacterized protein n=1 Tax=Dendrobium chrysotoxum TaxID=161865 RepID=A0AAV7GNE7_DENCH|nr:hypothetical protein IEQ34_012986 [Dendrobium chrysotoxum]